MAALSNMAVRDIETMIHPYTNLAKHRENGPLDHRSRQGRVSLRHIRASAISRASGAYGARRSATATRNSSRPRRRRCASCRSAISSAASRMTSPSSLPRSSRRSCRAKLPKFCSALGLGSQRHADEAHLVRQQRARPHQEEKNHQPDQGLSRSDDRRRQPHRTARGAHGFRPAHSPTCCMSPARITTATASRARRRSNSPTAW